MIYWLCLWRDLILRSDPPPFQSPFLRLHAEQAIVSGVRGLIEETSSFDWLSRMGTCQCLLQLSNVWQSPLAIYRQLYRLWSRVALGHRSILDSEIASSVEESEPEPS